jgi:recombination protein RecR
MFESKMQPAVITELINRLADLPSIGKKSAQRLAYFLLSQSPDKVEAFAKSILEAKLRIRECERCHNYAEDSLCLVCQDKRRQANLICVIEHPSDVLVFEKTGSYKGVYHILGGLISPLDGIGPDEIHIKTLLDRVKQSGNCELILSLNTSSEGETTMMYISRYLTGSQVKITRLARGIPLGSDLQYVDDLTMENAIENRVRL